MLGRCVGHGAFPVGRDELGKVNPEIKIKDVELGLDRSGGLFQHGYVIVELKGDQAAAAYFQFDPGTGQEKRIFDDAL